MARAKRHIVRKTDCPYKTLNPKTFVMECQPILSGVRSCGHNLERAPCSRPLERAQARLLAVDAAIAEGFVSGALWESGKVGWRAQLRRHMQLRVVMEALPEAPISDDDPTRV